jgi:hypothetical protein
MRQTSMFIVVGGKGDAELSLHLRVWEGVKLRLLREKCKE